jgi:hypothetical protein
MSGLWRLGWKIFTTNHEYRLRVILDRSWVLQMPVLMRRYELDLDLIMSDSRRSQKSDLLKLLDYVTEATGGRFYDAEVSALIGAVEGRQYTAEDHRKWRERAHKRRILTQKQQPVGQAPAHLPPMPGDIEFRARKQNDAK